MEYMFYRERVMANVTHHLLLISLCPVYVIPISHKKNEKTTMAPLGCRYSVAFLTLNYNISNMAITQNLNERFNVIHNTYTMRSDINIL